MGSGTSPQLSSANEQTFAGSVDGLRGDGWQTVETGYALELGKETIQQPEILLRNADESCRGPLQRRKGGGMRPSPGKEAADGRLRLAMTGRSLEKFWIGSVEGRSGMATGTGLHPSKALLLAITGTPTPLPIKKVLAGTPDPQYMEKYYVHFGTPKKVARSCHYHGGFLGSSHT